MAINDFSDQRHGEPAASSITEGSEGATVQRSGEFAFRAAVPFKPRPFHLVKPRRKHIPGAIDIVRTGEDIIDHEIFQDAVVIRIDAQTLAVVRIEPEDIRASRRDEEVAGALHREIIFIQYADDTVIAPEVSFASAVRHAQPRVIGGGKPALIESAQQRIRVGETVNHRGARLGGANFDRGRRRDLRRRELMAEFGDAGENGIALAETAAGDIIVPQSVGPHLRGVFTRRKVIRLRNAPRSKRGHLARDPRKGALRAGERGTVQPTRSSRIGEPDPPVAPPEHAGYAEVFLGGRDGHKVARRSHDRAASGKDTCSIPGPDGVIERVGIPEAVLTFREDVVCARWCDERNHGRGSNAGE